MDTTKDDTLSVATSSTSTASNPSENSESEVALVEIQEDDRVDEKLWTFLQAGPNGKMVYPSGLPSEEWGHYFWILLHVISVQVFLAAQKESEDEDILLDAMYGFMDSFRKALPCPVCYHHFTETLKKPKYAKPSQAADIPLWISRIHDQVNEDLDTLTGEMKHPVRSYSHDELVEIYSDPRLIWFATQKCAYVFMWTLVAHYHPDWANATVNAMRFVLHLVDLMDVTPFSKQASVGWVEPTESDLRSQESFAAFVFATMMRIPMLYIELEGDTPHVQFTVFMHRFCEWNAEESRKAWYLQRSSRLSLTPSLSNGPL